MTDKTYKCRDCSNTAEFSSKSKARNADWAIARDNKTCYCPKCAPRHRYVGRKGSLIRPDKQMRVDGL